MPCFLYSLWDNEAIFLEEKNRVRGRHKRGKINGREGIVATKGAKRLPPPEGVP